MAFTLRVTENLSDSVKAILIDGTAHTFCAKMFLPNNPNDSDSKHHFFKIVILFTGINSKSFFFNPFFFLPKFFFKFCIKIFNLIFLQLRTRSCEQEGPKDCEMLENFLTFTRNVLKSYRNQVMKN